jgi:hypothetical protein
MALNIALINLMGLMLEVSLFINYYFPALAKSSVGIATPFIAAA